MSSTHHGPPRRCARVDPERDKVGGAGDDARAVGMTRRERRCYFHLGARRRLDNAGETNGVGRWRPRTDRRSTGARTSDATLTVTAAHHRDRPFQNLRVDGAAHDAVRSRHRARQRRLERAPRVEAVAALDRYGPATVCNSRVCVRACV